MNPGTHYSMAFDLNRMQTLCNEAAFKLNEYQKENKCDIVFIYSGMSGIATATALAHYLYSGYDIVAHMIYVRKENDNNHNDSIVEWSENSQRYNKAAIFFIDDLIESGNTFNRTRNYASRAQFIKAKKLTNKHIGTILIGFNLMFNIPQKHVILDNYNRG